MKLLGTDNSPFVRKCRLVFAEKGVAYDYVIASPSDPKSGVAAANPLGKIPTMILDDGRGLYDFPVIVEYVDGLAPSPQLIPAQFEGRIEVKRWEALGDGIGDAAVEISHDRRRPPDQQLGEVGLDRQFKKVRAGLARMEADLRGRDWCHGTTFTLADIACWVAVWYVERVAPELSVRENHPLLKRHFERLSARPAFAGV